MTKILVWGVFIFIVGVYVDFHDNFSKKCKEAGGIPTMTMTSKTCLSVNSVVDVER